MQTRSFIGRTLVGALGTLIGAAALALAAHASEISTPANARGFVIHGPDETLRNYCRLDAEQVLWFELPGGTRFQLVTSAFDPAILNSGDGQFHPYDEVEVRAALAAVRFPLERIGAEIFLLPYPRRLGLESAAGPGLILLAPGVRALSPEHQHAELVHELGHVVQYALMPDTDQDAWARYRILRGIQDLSLYNASSPHADRPHEIFAEDFRSLFGDPLATYSGTIENAALIPSAQVAGLNEFIGGLAGVAQTPGALVASPNPARGPLTFTRRGVQPAPLDLFDIAGRTLATLEPTVVAGAVLWTWDGRTPAGRAGSPALVFARVRGERGKAARVTLLP